MPPTTHEIVDKKAKSTLGIALSTDDLGLFFEPHHTQLANELKTLLAGGNPFSNGDDPSTVALELGSRLDLYRHLIPKEGAAMDTRALFLIREALGQCSPLADGIFAVQGLGSFPLFFAGTEAQKRTYLPDIISAKRICAFGLTEPNAGSDVASLQTVASREGDDWVLSGEKTLISNIPIAHHVIVFANANPELGRKGITAFLVERSTPGLEMTPIALSGTHPLGRVFLKNCRVSDKNRIGEVGKGFGIAMATLDTFRVSVGAAACGMARRALTLTLSHILGRVQFNKPLAEQQIIQAKIADMATELDAARLLTLRAAHKKDTAPQCDTRATSASPQRDARATTEVAMAKMFATEAAQHIIDAAVQLHGGLGVTLETEVEHLYREIRPLRIYEGTTEIQKLIIAKALLERKSH